MESIRFLALLAGEKASGEFNACCETQLAQRMGEGKGVAYLLKHEIRFSSLVIPRKEMVIREDEILELGNCIPAVTWQPTMFKSWIIKS